MQLYRRNTRSCYTAVHSIAHRWIQLRLTSLKKEVTINCSFLIKHLIISDIIEWKKHYLIDKLTDDTFQEKYYWKNRNITLYDLIWGMKTVFKQSKKLKNADKTSKKWLCSLKWWKGKNIRLYQIVAEKNEWPCQYSEEKHMMQLTAFLVTQTQVIGKVYGVEIP